MPHHFQWMSLSLALLSASAIAGAAQPAVSPPPRESHKPTFPKQPDGTFLWTGSVAESERVLLTPQELQKLLDQIEQLKKDAAARKAVFPSGCAVHARIEKRGESLVAALRLTYAFRTTVANSAVSLGAKRSFLVSAKLDGQPLPVLETVESGFAIGVEAAGLHTAILDVECPIAARGTKPEIGFELGLPRAAITSLILEAPPGVARVALTTRTPEAGKLGEPRRIAGLDVKSLAPPAPMRDPYPLGPVESLEVAWEPAIAAPDADAAQAADLEGSVLLSEGLVETTARIKLRGTSRSWRIAAPADAVLNTERVSGSGEPGIAPPITKPTDAAKPVWKLEIPAGTASSDWMIVVTIRSTRAKPNEPAFRGPFAVGPLSVLDVAKTTGTIRVAAPANTRLTFKHGRELRQEAPPIAPSDDETVGFFRLSTGSIGNPVPAEPLLTFEAAPLAGRIAVRPNYKLSLTDSGWNLRAEIRVVPIRTSIDSVIIDLPASWRGVELSPPNIVEEATELKTDGMRKLLKIVLAAERKQPFELALAASVPFGPAAKDAMIPLLRFPNATERDTLASATVPEGTDLRGSGREWDGEQPAAWSVPLPAISGSDGKIPRNVTTLSGKFDRGLARLDLAWAPFRPPLTAEVRADLTVRDSQIHVSQRVTLRSPDGLPRTVRFRGAEDLPGLAPFDRIAPGTWLHGFGPDLKEATVKFEYAVPLPPRTGNRASRTVPISLVLPVGTSRTDVVTRVWEASSGSRSVGASPGAWREVPPDPAAEREGLPALTLAASGGELPLTLDIRDEAGDAATAIWIERGLMQASHGDDGVAIRARFLLRRWFADSLDVKLPASLDSAIPEVYLDDPPKRIPAAIRTENGERILRVPLPESKSGRTVVVELRYAISSRPVGEVASYSAPEPYAVFGGPLRWHISGPAGSVPLLLGKERSEQRWRTRFGMVVPVPASEDEMEKWFLSGAAEGSANGGGESTVVLAEAPNPVAVLHLPRLAFIIGCSIGVLLIGLALARFPSWLAGPAVAVFAGAVAIATVLYPQPASQAAAAAEPGFAVLVLVLVVQAAARWYHHRRITYLPGFARTLPEPAPTSGGSRPSDRVPPNASTGALLPQSASSGS